MTTYQSPGVYRQEVFLKPRAALPTGVPGFVGFADEAHTGTAEPWVQLSGLPEGAELPPTVTTGVSYDGTLKRLVSAGAMASSAYRMLLLVSPDESYRKAVKDLYRQSQTMLNRPVALHRKEEFAVRFNSLPPEESYLADAVNGFFDNGGGYCYVVHTDASENPKDALVTAVESLSSLSDLDLVAVPDAMTLFLRNGEIDIASVVQVQKHVLAYCTAQGNRFAILDGLGGGSVGTVLNEQCKELKKKPEEVVEKNKRRQKNPMNGALYFPWIKTSANRCIPPCGHVAGIYARTDGKAGTHKAPANEDLRGVVDLERPVDNTIQDRLNPEGVNCLRAFPGRGIRVWGARTLSRDPAWRYVNIRRLVLTLGRWIDANMTWAAFEPNTPHLWIRIQRELAAQLGQLWLAGALKGNSPDQAFYVKCDAETNPPEERAAGEVVTEVGLAPATPAEFIVVRIIHRAGTTELD
jgi:Bacteriophage tail sheath protein